MSFDDDQFEAEYVEGMHPGLRTPLLETPWSVRRGGIHYPKPEGTTMPERMTKAQIARELELNDQIVATLRERRLQLQQMKQTALPAEPHNFTMFTIGVRFKMRGKTYQFLILRSGGKYFTTGARPEHSSFDSWEDLCAWLEGPDVYSHTNLETLQSSGLAVSFDTGKIERMDPAGTATGVAPF